MTTQETLKAAREVIAKPENWCKWELVTEHEDGTYGAPYCALGAIGVASGAVTEADGFRFYSPGNAFHEAVTTLEGVLPDSVANYNNTHDHECVLAAFDAAIEKA